MVDQEVIGSQLKRDRFPFQSEGDITLAVRNANYTIGPVMLHIDMKPGAVIPAHLQLLHRRHECGAGSLRHERAKSPGSPHRLLAIHSAGYGAFNPQRPYYIASHALLSQCKTLPCDRDSAWHLDADEVHVQGAGETQPPDRDVKRTA